MQDIFTSVALWTVPLLKKILTVFLKISKILNEKKNSEDFFVQCVVSVGGMILRM